MEIRTAADADREGIAGLKLVVDESHRARGIGSALVEQARACPADRP